YEKCFGNDPPFHHCNCNPSVSQVGQVDAIDSDKDEAFPVNKKQQEADQQEERPDEYLCMIIELHPKKPVSHVDSDSDVEKNHTLDDVAHVVDQFEHEDEGNVNIPRMTTDDPWLNKLVRNCTFIGQTDNLNPNLQGRFLLEVEDLDDKQVEYKFEAKHNMSYPSFNPDTPWNECKPVLRMRFRFKSPQQLKHMLANYDVQYN
ncbi:hypothetical protein Tco_0558572, partial [Tanacetum coccineum]